MKKILLVGMGVQGCRVAEAATSINDLQIDTLSEKPYPLLNSDKMKKINNNFSLDDLKKIRDKYSLVYISVGAKYQSEILSTLSKVIKTKTYIIEKNLTQKLADIKFFKEFKHPKIYVNLWIRNMKAIAYLQNFSQEIISISIRLKRGDLLSNALHYLDFIEQITQSPIKQIDFFAFSDFFDSKRSYAKEIEGKYYGKLVNNVFFEILTCENVNSESAINIGFYDKTDIYLDDELVTITNVNGAPVVLDNKFVTSRDMARVIYNLIYDFPIRLPHLEKVVSLQEKMMKSLDKSLNTDGILPLA